MRTLCLLVVGVVVGWSAAGMDWSRQAVGQEAAKNPELPGIGAAGPELKRRIDEWTQGVADYSQINRYQISAYGTQTSNGCYVVDTTTGKVWRVGAGQPVVIAGELPEK